ncbi:MAG: LLM class flavin-dependent oxidoreductase, partial [Chloroflexi bacterium]|nr:LLM class flavin-dependent oxidoreductase [Chloroflexota bacterium]
VRFEVAVVRLAGALVSPGPERPPRWYLGGASERALALAGSQGDQLLMWIQPLEEIAALIARARAQFAAAERPPEFGLRTHLVVRDTEDAAWAAADELLSRADPEVVAQRQAAFAGTAMVGQRAQLRASEQHRLGPHLWNGISTVRVNLGTAIVGTPAQVANELLAYWRLGIDEFILSGYPHVEECERVAADVLPLLQAQIRAEAAR